MNEKKYWLWLTMIFGAGSRRIWELMNLFEDAHEAYEQLMEDTSGIELTAHEQRNLKRVDISAAERLIEKCSSRGIGITSYSDADYPARLRYITNPPAVLYYRGNISCLSAERTVTSVGARKSGTYGLRAAREICGALARNGFVIISGFALGIDITSHLAAAEAGFPTACVLGCGVDIDYPKENIRHRQTILDAGGVFVSEFPPGTSPFAPNFPKRNRILAALGSVAVVFEATTRSGSLITANLASEQGREIFCLPPADIFGDAFSGNTALLRSGAVPLYGVEEIFDHFGLMPEPEEDSEVRISSFAEELDVPDRKSSAKKAKKKHAADTAPAEEAEPEKTSAAPAELPDDLTDVQRSIAELLRNGALHADEIAARLEIDQTELMTELTELELTGTVRQTAGKMFELC